MSIQNKLEVRIRVWVHVTQDTSGAKQIAKEYLYRLHFIQSNSQATNRFEVRVFKFGYRSLIIYLLRYVQKKNCRLIHNFHFLSNCFFFSVVICYCFSGSAPLYLYILASAAAAAATSMAAVWPCDQMSNIFVMKINEL